MTRPTLRTTLAAGALILAGLGTPAMTQTVVPADEAVPAAQRDDRLSEASECPPADTLAEPATKPDASEDATAPENTGTTGWSGGTGGSQLGTNIQGAVDTSPTWQPPTARGLDLAGLAEPVVQC